MLKALTTHINVATSQTLRRRLEAEALRQRRTLSATVRIMLEEALEFCESTLAAADPTKNEYEIMLSFREATRLAERGFVLHADGYEQLPLPNLD